MKETFKDAALFLARWSLKLSEAGLLLAAGGYILPRLFYWPAGFSLFRLAALEIRPGGGKALTLLLLYLPLCFLFRSLHRLLRRWEETDSARRFFSGRTLPHETADHVKLSSRGKAVFLRPEQLTKTVAVIGAMGTGKTYFLKTFYDYSRRFHPDAPIFLHDPKGDWLPALYDTADLERNVVYAPYDMRSVGWDLFGDLKRYPQLTDLLAKAAILAHQKPEDDTFWISAGAVALADALQSEDVFEAKEKLVARKRKEADNKTFQSIHSTLMSGFRDIASICLTGRTEFGIDDFLSGGRNVFLVNTPDLRESNAGPLNIFLTALITRLLSMKNTASPGEIRALFIIDEALQFHLPETTEKDLLNTSRSKGIAYIGSVQQFPQKGKEETPFVKAHTKFVFGLNHPDTAQTISEWTKFQYEKKVKVHSSSADGKGLFAGSSSGTSWHKEIKEGHRIEQDCLLNKMKEREFFVLRGPESGNGWRKNGNFTKARTKDARLTGSRPDPVESSIYYTKLRERVSMFMTHL